MEVIGQERDQESAQAANRPLAARPVRSSTQVEPWLPGNRGNGASAATQTAEAEATDLPTPPVAADLARGSVRWYWLVLCFGVTFLAYVAFIPQIIRYSNPPTGDQPYYLMVTSSIVQDFDLELTNNYANNDFDRFYNDAPHPPDYVGMSAPYPLTPHRAYANARPPEETYNFHWPGLSVLLAPAWLIGSWFSLWWPATIVFMCLLGSLVALNIFLLAHEMTGRVWIALLVWLSLAFSAPLMDYAFLIFSELATGLLVIYSFRRLALGWGANGPLRLLLVGACIGFIPLLSWRCVIIAAGLALYAAVQWWRYRRASATLDEEEDAGVKGRRATILSAVLLIGPVLLFGGLLIAYHFFLFGSPLPDPRIPERPNEDIFFWPWRGTKELTNFLTAAFGLFLDRNWGLLIYSPIYLLAAVGLIAMFRSQRGSDRRLLVAMAPVALPYLGLIMAYIFWYGIWSPPARMLTVLLPLMAAPLAMSLHACRGWQGWIYKLIYLALSVVGWGLMAIPMYDPRLLWPSGDATIFEWLAGASGFTWTLDLREYLPGFEPPEEDGLPLDSARLLIAAFAIVLVSSLLAAWSRRKAPVRTRPLPFAAQGLAWIFAALVLGGGWYAMNYDYIKPRTLLLEKGRWAIGANLNQPYGISYLNDKIYIAQYEGQALGEFDFKTGVYTPITPTIGGTPTNFDKVGDVQTNPDGTLYVLNNGGGDRSLFVMQPDGTILRQVFLNDKTPVATGMYLGGDGSIYTADMLGGKIQKWANVGGKALGVWGGMKGGFNNPSGVAVGDDGTIYAAESSFERIQVLDPNGTFRKNYDLRCRPWHAVWKDGWLDITCNKGIISVNTRGDYVQLSRYGPNQPRPGNPTGITYGSDGTLYVLDGNVLIAYDVQH